MAATIPIFDGENENYKVWNVRMKTLFQSKDLWDMVEKGYVDETDKVCQKRNAEALSLIQQGVSDWVLKKIMKAKKAKDAWDFLQEKFPTEERPTPPIKAPAKALALAKAKIALALEKAEKTTKALGLEKVAKARKALSSRSLAVAQASIPVNISKSKETNLIVATLIATVAFAAGITMPGGYINDNKDPNQGMAILTRKAAFKAFVITDTIALTLSVFAVLIHLYIMTDHPVLLKRQIGLAFACTAYALIAMLLAFITGTYAVLASSSLSIKVCVIPSILSVSLLIYCNKFFPVLTSEDIQPFSPPRSPPSEENV